MKTHDIHGVEVNFHTGTDHIVKTLRAMPKEEAMKFLEGSHNGQSSILDSRIHHKEIEGNHTYEVELHHHN